jgi:hypothetical protein
VCVDAARCVEGIVSLSDVFAFFAMGDRPLRLPTNVNVNAAARGVTLANSSTTPGPGTVPGAAGSAVVTPQPGAPVGTDASIAPASQPQQAMLLSPGAQPAPTGVT